MSIKKGFNFHQTFGPALPELAAMLRLAHSSGEESTKPSTEFLQSGTGLGNKKVGPVLKWAQFSELIEFSAFRPTPLGHLVFERDPDLASLISSWTIHLRMSRWMDFRSGSEEDNGHEPGPIPWRILIHEFLPLNPTFERSALEAAYELEFEGNAGEAPSPKYLTSTTGLVIKTYTDPSSLGRLNILEENPGFPGWYRAGEPELPNHLVFLTCLAFIWQDRFAGENAVNREILMEGPGGVATSMGLTASEAQRLLDRLTSEGIVSQNRAVKPHMVVRRDVPLPLEALNSAYG